MKWGLIGCGLIGRKRAAAIPKGDLVAAYDLFADRAQGLKSLNEGLRVCASIEEVLNLAEVVVVATDNASLAKVTRTCVTQSKHVLVEKPAGIRSQELQEIDQLARTNKALVRVGFNHRFHPAFRKAQEIVASGQLGRLMYIRARYGHGGRVGYEKEWRFNAELSGGGELIDQGVHLIDLSRMFLPELRLQYGAAYNYFWNTALDDNAFVHLTTPQAQTAWFHVSCSEWKNLFNFELYGTQAKLVVEGLGGSYGVERLYHYQMTPKMGPPDTVVYEYPQEDRSWALEVAEMAEDIRLWRPPNPGLGDAIIALQTVEKIYAQPVVQVPR